LRRYIRLLDSTGSRHEIVYRGDHVSRLPGFLKAVEEILGGSA